MRKSTSYFVDEIKKINSCMFNALNKDLRPYLTNVKLQLGNYEEEINSSIITYNPVNDKVYQNMNNVLSSEVKGKTFLKKNCKKYMDENSDSVNNVFEFGLPYTIDFVDE